MSKTFLTTEDDHIVEQGRSNGWDYRKWANGVAECWRTVTAPVKTTDWNDSGMLSFPLLSGFGLFWTKGIMSGKDIQLDYPFAFVARPVETAFMTTTLQESGKYFPLTLISATSKQTDKTDAYRLCTYKKLEEDIEATISFNVIGRWK